MIPELDIKIYDFGFYYFHGKRFNRVTLKVDGVAENFQWSEADTLLLVNKAKDKAIHFKKPIIYLTEKEVAKHLEGYKTEYRKTPL